MWVREIRGTEGNDDSGRKRVLPSVLPSGLVRSLTLITVLLASTSAHAQDRGNLDTQNLGRPADVWVHPPTNELFVADGYGNRRVIVYDADTGAFKRMWGAFGDEVTEGVEADPAWAREQEGSGPPHFSQPVHAAKVSDDGLVYVSDRGGKRVQVFTLEGEYVSQVFIGRECLAPECGNGTTAARPSRAWVETWCLRNRRTRDG